MRGITQRVVRPKLIQTIESSFLSKAAKEKARGFVDHPAGPLTIHFWAPSFKWGLVIAGLFDLNKPVEKISSGNAVALSATGIIWSRYATQILPVNYNLLSVNIFVAGTGLYQLYRKYAESPSTDKSLS